MERACAGVRPKSWPWDPADGFFGDADFSGDIGFLGAIATVGNRCGGAQWWKTTWLDRMLTKWSQKGWLIMRENENAASKSNTPLYVTTNATGNNSTGACPEELHSKGSKSRRHIYCITYQTIYIWTYGVQRNANNSIHVYSRMNMSWYVWCPILSLHGPWNKPPLTEEAPMMAQSFMEPRCLTIYIVLQGSWTKCLSSQWIMIGQQFAGTTSVRYLNISINIPRYSSTPAL